jgi:hypothetical protein
MTVFRPVHLLFKVENRCRAVFVKEPPALCDRRNIRRAGGVLSVLLAAEHTLHADPLGDDDRFGLYPREVCIAMFRKQCFQPLAIPHADIISSPAFRPHPGQCACLGIPARAEPGKPISHDELDGASYLDAS